ncbi:MAG: hypothetical protein QXI39_04220 [Candidatus Bathyarchaeia archaeon]
MVKAVNDLTEEKRNATDSEIAEVLAKRRLSKLKYEKIRDRIHRRARDHLLNAAYLGLVTRSARRPFNYHPTPSGTLLRRYQFTDECPKDSLEKAVFISRLMRLKLTNVYDLQFRKTYIDYMTRPFVFLINLLKYQPLHIYQLYQALGEKHSDPKLNPETLKKILDEYGQYKSYEDKSIQLFCDNFNMGEAERKEARRSAKPMLDWCEQLGLVFRRDDWYYTTELGFDIAERSSESYPIWFHQLGDDAELKASIILTYRIVRNMGGKVKKRGLCKTSYPSLIASSVDVEGALNDLQSKFRLFNKNYSQIKQVDFDLFYDVPPDKRRLVENLVTCNLKQIGIEGFDLKNLETNEINTLEETIRETVQEKTIIKMSEIMGFDIPRPELFKVPFEWTVCFLLRSINYRAEKYQGQFSEFCDLPIAEENPDIIIENATTCLVECKSVNEWGSVVRLDKRVSGEILNYQTYIEAIKANSALLVCEGRFEKDFTTSAVKIMERARNVIMATQNYLANIVRDKSLKGIFDERIRNPESFDSKDRILS